MGYLLSVLPLVYVLPQSLQCHMDYHVLCNHGITAPDCIIWNLNEMICWITMKYMYAKLTFYIFLKHSYSNQMKQIDQF